MIRCKCSDWDINFQPKDRNKMLDIQLMLKRIEPRHYEKEPKPTWIIWMEVNVVKALVSKYLWWNDDRVEELYNTLDRDEIEDQITDILNYDINNEFPNGIEKAVVGMCYINYPFKILDKYLIRYYLYKLDNAPVNTTVEWMEFIPNKENFESLWDNYSTDRPWKKLWDVK